MTLSSATAGERPAESAVPDRDPSPTRRRPPIALNVELLAGGLVLALAGILRWRSLSSAYPTTDEGLRLRAAWFFAHGQVTAGWPGDSASACAALLMRLWGDSLALVRLPALIPGIACVAALFLFRSYAGPAVALIAALLIAASPVAVVTSRILSPDALGLLCGLVTLWAVLRFADTGDRRTLFVLFLAIGVGMTTGAVFIAVALVAVLWLATEVGWCDRREIAAHWSAALRTRAVLLEYAAPVLIGLVAGVTRFGAGVQRVSVPAFADWAGPGGDAPPRLPWHAVFTVLLGYEPLVLLLAVAGVVAIVLRWRWEGAGAVTPFERLLLLWAASGVIFSAVTLHARPGQLVIVTVPFALLAASATVHGLSTLAHGTRRLTLLPLVPAAIIGGFILMRGLGWSNEGYIPNRELAGVSLLLLAVAGLIALSAYRAGRSAPAILIGASWATLSWLALHGTAGVVTGTGTEYVLGERPDPLRMVAVQTIGQAVAQGQSVSLQRDVGAALAWETRGLNISLFTGNPSASDLIVRTVNSGSAAGGTVIGLPVTVQDRWYPTEWDGPGIVRWMAHRQPWGRVQRMSVELLQGTE